MELGQIKKKLLLRENFSKYLYIIDVVFSNLPNSYDLLLEVLLKLFLASSNKTRETQEARANNIPLVKSGCNKTVYFKIIQT